MGSYYKHTQTQSIKVPYSFRCEQCLRDSGMLEAVITGSANLNTHSKVLLDREQAKLSQLAHAALVREVQSVHQDAVQKHVYAAAFYDECPHCHQPQSWAIAQMKSDQFTTPIVFVVVGLIISFGVHFFTDVKSLTVALGIFAAGVVAAAAAFAWNRIKISSKQKKTAVSMEHNLPSIQWEAVRDLLEEH